MSDCGDGTRRTVTLSVADGEHETYSVTSAPIADLLLTVSAPGGGVTNVVVAVSADGESYAPAWGVGLVDGESAHWTIPRAVAAIRVSAVGGAATFEVAILEAA